MVDLALIDLPGGPYRLRIIDHHGAVTFHADAVCACPLDPGGHWHEAATASTHAGLLAALDPHPAQEVHQ